MPQRRHPGLQGRRVLVVEDEFLIALTLEQALVAQGCVVLGPFGGVEAALQAVQRDAPDLAILDVNLMGEKVYPVAAALEARHVPFLLATGYDGESALPREKPAWRICGKPYTPASLMQVLAEIAGPAPA